MENYMANGKEVSAEHKFSHCPIEVKWQMADNASESEKAEKRRELCNCLLLKKKKQPDRVKIY